MTANPFTARLRDGVAQTGLWLNLPGSAAAEIAGAAGFEWVLLDQEHAPRSLDRLVSDANAAERHGAHAIVRVSGHDPHELGRMLDLGFRTILVPMVESAAQAALLASAMDFPPRGIRGVSSQTRGGAWGTDPSYLLDARAELCLIAQIESAAGVAEVEGIAATGGVDAIFVGAADLAASLGHLGDPGHPEVQEAIARVIDAVRGLGKPLGTLAKGAEAAKAAFDSGYTFVGVGTDTAILASAHRALRAQFQIRED